MGAGSGKFSPRMSCNIDTERSRQTRKIQLEDLSQGVIRISDATIIRHAAQLPTAPQSSSGGSGWDRGVQARYPDTEVLSG